jgi:capsular polysaccharide biosynthesis protein
MVTNWTVREEILSLSQRWYWLVSAFLAGSLLGWGISWILPPVYQAQIELFVAINADTEFTNPDDYKNWQMGQLDAFIMSAGVIQEVLSQLKGLDSGWEGHTAQDLRSMLSVRWRNAGQWRLVATASDAAKASRLAQVWSEVVFERVSEALVHADRFVGVDRKLDALNYELLLTREHLLGLEQAGDDLRTFEFTGLSRAAIFSR